MQYVTIKRALLVTLISLSGLTTSHANNQEALVNLGLQALTTCQKLSANISEAAVLAKMNGQWKLITYASKLSGLAKKLATSYIPAKDVGATDQVIQAIVSKAEPTLKKLIIELLDLSQHAAEAFWQSSGDSIKTSLKSELRIRLTQAQAEYALHLLNQEHFEPFIAIIAMVLKQHLNNAPEHDKAMIKALSYGIAMQATPVTA